MEDKEWIYRDIPSCDIDFDKIEQALGFKLFIWQKTFIINGVFRQYGETTARILRRLLQKDEPLDFRKRPKNGREYFERKMTFEIYKKLKAAGIEVCEIKSLQKH